MSQMNSRNRKKNYQFLSSQYGEYCRICGESGDFYTLVIDHIDGDNDNNNLQNFEFLCRKCNYIKDPARKKHKPRVLSPARVCECVLPIGKTAEMEKNSVAEPFFRRWLFALLRQDVKIKYNIMIEWGAEASHSSIDALKRYARKVHSPGGWTELVKDENGVLYVQLKKPWQKKNDKEGGAEIEKESKSDINISSEPNKFLVLKMR